jgi:hypothetical protein
MANPYLELSGLDETKPTAANPYLDIAGEKTKVKEQPVEQSYAAGLARSGLGQGAALGFGDEIVAGLRTIFGENWEDAIKDERAKVEKFRKENPGTALTAEIVGGFATPGMGLLTGALKAAPTALGRIAQSAKIGGVAGATHGFGSAEGNAIERLPGTAAGGAAGAVLGGALPVVGTALGGTVRAARDFVAPTLARARHGVDEASTEVLATKLRRAGKTPQDVADDLQVGRDAGFGAGLPEALVDASPTLQRLGGSVYRAGNEAGEIAQGFVAGRQGGEPVKGLFGKPTRGDEPANQYERVIDQVKRAFQVKSKDFDKAQATIRAEQQTAGNADYANAWAKQEGFDLGPSLQVWAVKAMDEPGKEGEVIRGVIKIFANRKGFDATNDHLGRFDKAKRALDGLIGEADRTGNNNIVRLLTEMKHDLLRAVHATDAKGLPTKNLAYQEARDAWGSRAELLNALQMGRKFVRGADEVSVADFNAMTRAEKSMFRLGVSDGLEKVLGGKPLGPTVDYTREFFKPNVMKRLQAVMPGGQTTERMNEVIRRESRMSDTAKEVLGNSKTAQRAQDDVELGRDLLSQAVDRYRSTPSMLNVVIDATKYASEKVFGFRDDMATALARKLFTADRAEQDKILAEVAKRYGTPKLDEFFQMVNNLSLGATTNAAGQISGAMAEAK